MFIVNSNEDNWCIGSWRVIKTTWGSYNWNLQQSSQIVFSLVVCNDFTNCIRAYKRWYLQNYIAPYVQTVKTSLPAENDSSKSFWKWLWIKLDLQPCIGFYIFGLLKKHFIYFHLRHVMWQKSLGAGVDYAEFLLHSIISLKYRHLQTVLGLLDLIWNFECFYIENGHILKSV